jgi:hypothetical protein
MGVLLIGRQVTVVLRAFQAFAPPVLVVPQRSDEAFSLTSHGHCPASCSPVGTR